MLQLCRTKECERWQDRALSLGLCGDGTELRVYCGNSRQQCALQVLCSCKRSLSSCSFTIVADVLGLVTKENWQSINGRQTLLPNVPYVEYTLSRSLYSRKNQMMETIDISLTSLFNKHNDSITIRMLLGNQEGNLSPRTAVQPKHLVNTIETPSYAKFSLQPQQ